ncbi:M24 family metallopeptidase, partial [Pseudoalteromonas sp. S1649]|uniref:M24 family metallopeptidase n=1 Tax=Pseudoalteromonas sp. S1649 TaxID=579508 RepID=UPI0020172648
CALPNGSPSERTLSKGLFITLEFCAGGNGYRSDMTRSYVLGKASKKQSAIYQSVSNAQQAAINLLKAGVNCLDLQKISQQVLDDSGFGEWAVQRFGHGVGLI